MNKEKFITGIDIGTSKVCCFIGKRKRPDVFDILGCGISFHDCVRKGCVIDLKGASDAISKAVYKAEADSGKKVHTAFINVSTPDIKGILSAGETIISDRDSEITHYDSEKVTENARAINIPYEREVLHAIHHGFTVDGEKNIVDPSGMFGFKLGAQLYLITIKASLVENLKKAVRQSGIGVAGVVTSSIPTSMALLSEHERQIGTILIDIGADLTEVSIYTEGLLRYIKVVPTGGDYITDSISRKFRLPEALAERIKIEDGALDQTFSDDDKLMPEADSNKKPIYKKDLQEVLKNSYNDAFAEIKKAVYESQIFRDAANGVVLAGGVSIVDGVAEKAEIELGIPVRVAHITELGACLQPLPSHVFATAAGLIKYGFKMTDKNKGFLEKGAKNIFTSFLSYAHSLYKEYF
ncbi:MAG: cell division protein FtsA [Candidatus Omnitrophota bacterium]